AMYGMQFYYGCFDVNVTKTVIDGSGMDGLMINGSCHQFTIWNNDFYNNTHSGFSAVVNCSDSIVVNNTFGENGVSTTVDDSCNTVFRHLNNCSGFIDALIIIDDVPALSWIAAISWGHGINGTGTLSDPYTIAGITFQGEGQNKSGIIIANSTAHATVTGCSFINYSSAGDHISAGVLLTTTGLVSITGNVFEDCMIGIAMITTLSCNVSSNTISRGIGAVLGSDCHNVTIAWNSIDGMVMGGIFLNGENASILNNTITATNETAILVSNGRHVTMEGNEIQNASDGIVIEFCDDVITGWNVLENMTTFGINVTTSTNICIQGNTITNCGTYGIYYVGINATIVENQVQGTGQDGIYLRASTGSLIRLNKIRDSQENGLYVIQTTASRIIGNEIWNCNYNGMKIADLSIITLVSGNIVRNTTLEAIWVDSTSGAYQNFNSINGTVYGTVEIIPYSHHAWLNVVYEIPFWFSGNVSEGDACFIKDFVLVGNIGISSDYGVFGDPYSEWSLLTISNVTINGNLKLNRVRDVLVTNVTVNGVLIVSSYFYEGRNVTIDGCMFTMVSYDGNNVSFSNNVITGSVLLRPRIYGDTFLRNNSFMEPLRLDGTLAEMGMLDLDDSNTVRGKPIRFFYAVSNTEMNTMPTFGQLIFAHATNVIIRDLHETNCTVYLIYCTDIILQNNTLDDAFGDGITISKSDRIIVRGNSISNVPGKAFFAENVNDLQVLNNTIWLANHGVWLENDPGANVSGNTMSLVGSPVSAYNSADISLLLNFMSSFDVRGAYIVSCLRPIVHGNTLVSSASDDSLVLYYSWGPTITSNTLHVNSTNGIDIYNSDYPVLKWNNVVNTGGAGIQIYSSSFATIQGNTIEDCAGDGVYIYWSVNATIETNVITGNGGYGMHAFNDADYIRITGNLISRNVNGGVYIVAEYLHLASEHGVILSNMIDSNTGCGIDL
nr:right-handed parallel beta-helix repeat-containing protein [Candidatus Sigynarchaeota archaeon]